MKKTIITNLLLLLSLYAICQVNSVKKPENKGNKSNNTTSSITYDGKPLKMNFVDYLSLSSSMKYLVWSKHYESENENSIVPTFSIKDGFDSVLKEPSIIKYKGQILEQLKSLTSYDLFITTPVNIIDFTDGSKAYIVDAATNGEIMNTLRLDEKERANLVITDYILPSLKSFESINIPSIKYYGFSFFYSSKDFSNDGLDYTKNEYLLLLTPASLLRKYNNASITKEALLKGSRLYLKGRNSFSVKLYSMY